METAMKTTREQHMQWCKDRALEYARQGNAKDAVASMLSDLGKHPDTRGSVTSCGPLAMMLMMSGQMETRKQIEDFINGFN